MFVTPIMFMVAYPLHEVCGLVVHIITQIHNNV